MKRKTSVVLLFIGLLLSYGEYSKGNVSFSQEENYEDAKLVLKVLAVSIEDFVENMNKVDQPEDIAKVLDNFAESMKGLVPKFNEIIEKYPEFKEEDTHPEELKPLFQRIDKDFQEMMKVYGKVNANIDDPAVKEADKKYKEVMSRLG